MGPSFLALLLSGAASRLKSRSHEAPGKPAQSHLQHITRCRKRPSGFADSLKILSALFADAAFDSRRAALTTRKAFVTMTITMGGMIRSFLGHVLPKVIQPLRVLWNEMIGFLFLLLAAPAAWSAIKSFRNVDQDSDNLFRAFLAVIFAGVMTFFGISSFLRARRISRS